MSCYRFRDWMSDAATDGLSVRQRAEFDSHVGGCSACREEFARVRALVKAIDRGVMTQAAAEPSPEFLAGMRRKIAAEASPSLGNWTRWAPAAACATAIVLATAVWILWPQVERQGQVIRNVPGSNSPTVTSQTAPNRGSVVAVAPAPEHRSDFVSMRRVAAHNPRRFEREPEVLVPPGEAESVMELAALLRNGKLDGAKLMAELQQANEPIEIKPLVIPLLDSTVQAQVKDSAPDGQATKREFVSGESAQGLLP